MPLVGVLSFTLNAMDEQFAGMIDVTTVYRPWTGKDHRAGQTQDGREGFGSKLCSQPRLPQRFDTNVRKRLASV